MHDRNDLSVFLRDELDGFAELEDEIVSQREDNLRSIGLSSDFSERVESAKWGYYSLI